MTSSAADKLVSLLLRSMRLMQIIPGRKKSIGRDFLAFYMMISNIVQIYYAGLLVIRNIHNILIVATGVKTIAVCCQVRRAKQTLTVAVDCKIIIFLDIKIIRTFTC